MSGGIDSTTVSALAAAAQPGIRAFTLAFDGEASERSELEEARATAAKHNMDHVYRFVREESEWDAIDDTVRCLEEPFAPFAPSFVISRLAAERNAIVALSGLGGDELFCGYSRNQVLFSPNPSRAGAMAAMRKIGRFFGVVDKHSVSGESGNYAHQ